MDTDDISVFSSGHELPSALRGMTASRLLSVIGLAEGGSTEELFALYRDVIASDAHIQSEFAKRKDAVLGDTVAVLPFDKADPRCAAGRELCAGIVDGQPFATLCDWLLNAALYPVAVAEKVFAPAPGGYRLARVVPVPYRLLDYSGGSLKIFDADAQGNRLSTSREPDPARYVVHRGHNLPLPDTWGGPMRACLFWWLLKTMSRQWWAELLERFGMPFLKGKFSDDQGKAILTRAFAMAQRLGGVVISKNTEVEMVQAVSGDSSNSHERFIDVCNREISRLIVGQTLSSTADATGLGSGTASLQGAVKDDIRKKDARLLAVTVRGQLFAQLCAINGVSGPAPLVVFGSDSAAEMASLVGLVKGLGEAGLEPDDDALDTISERVGFHVRRKASAPSFQGSPFTLHALSAPAPQPSPGDLDGDVGALAAAFSGRYAPLRKIIAESASSADCLRRCKEWLAAHENSAAAEILSDAMAAYAMRGASTVPLSVSGECQAENPAECRVHGMASRNREHSDKGFQDRYGNSNPEYLAAHPEENFERGKAVFSHLLGKKEGEVVNAMYRNDIGWIDADYGTPGNPNNDWKGGHGVSHIVAKHDGAIDGVVDILQNGTAYKHDVSKRKVYIIKDRTAIVLSKKRDGRLLITDYERISDGQLERYTSKGKYHAKGENE